MTATLFSEHALAPSTATTYLRALSLYAEYMKYIVHSNEFFPMSQRNIMNFITYLFDAGLNASTITTYMSGLSFYCKLLPSVDPANSFAARKLLTATRRVTGSPDSRLPIWPYMISDIIAQLRHMNIGLYDQCLYPAMYLLAFNAFLRVGEFTAKNKTDMSKMIQFHDLIYLPNLSGERLLQLTIRNFKGNTSGTPVFLLLPPSPIPTLCLHSAMNRYLAMRGSKTGPLFIWDNGDPVTSNQFASFLKLNLIKAGFSTDGLRTHSFRIGACSYASSLGLPDDVVMKLGRWKSSAFQKYIRLPTRTAHPLL